MCIIESRANLSTTETLEWFIQGYAGDQIYGEQNTPDQQVPPSWFKQMTSPDSFDNGTILHLAGILLGISYSDHVTEDEVK